MSGALKRRLLRLIVAVACAALMAAVFAAYLRPSFVLDLANRFILC